MKNLLKGIRLIAVLALTIAFVGCNEDDVVLPQVEAGFTHTINQDTGTVTFLNTSSNADAYEWDFGDGTSSTEINPIKTYTSGTYTIILEASNVSGASDTFEDTITISIPEVIAFPISFDNPLVNYEGNVFNGAAFQVVANPDESGANPTASNVGEIVNSGAAFEGFFFDLGAPLDLTTDKTVKVLFWADTAVDVLLKLENGTGADTEVVASHTGSGWEELYFTFDSSFSYDTITFFVDGPGTTAGTFYLDTICQINTSEVPCVDTELNFPIDFDCETIDYAEKIVGNVSFTVVDNPELSGINATASKVGQMTNVGENFENAFFNLDTPIDFSTDNGITLKLFSEQALPVLLKFEDGTEANVEDLQMHTGSGWEEMTFTLESTGSYNDMVLFVAFNQTDAGTFYIDDLVQVAGESTADMGSITECAGGTLVNDFETADDSIFNNFGGGVGTIVDNTDTTINMSTKKATYVKNAGEVFGGITIGLDSNIDFDAGTFSIDVNSQSVRQLLFKLEGLNIELILPTSGTGWETINYDFSASAGNVGAVTGITLIMDNGVQGDGSADWTIDFDNIRLCSNGATSGGTLVECSGGELLNNYETADNSIFNNFGGGVGTIEDNTDMSVNTSAKIGKYVKNAGEVFGGITIALDSNIDFDSGTFSLDVSTQAVRQLLFKLEGLNIELILPTSGTGWETLNYDFSAVAGNVGMITGITLISDNGTQGDGSEDWTVYFDNMRLCSNGGTSTGSCPAPAAGEFITDGDFEANAGCWELIDNGGVTTISTSISNGGSNSGQIKTTPTSNPALKQTRFGVGQIQPNTTYVVTFDIQANASDMPADGAVFQAFAFSEPAEGSTDAAVQHVLVAGDASFSTTWQNRNYTFTTGANVDGGASLLLELVCGGAASCTGTVNIDNVSLQAQ